MALIGWILLWELMAAYGLPLLEWPIDALVLLTWGLIGLAAGWYGLEGRYWQKIAWLCALAWYVSQLARYVGTVDPIAATAPALLTLLLGILYIAALPMAWVLSLGAVAAWDYWWADDDDEE